jgi:RodZ C-terminal domain
MSRLRVRIELNRGGVGVPLEKLASVVQQAQAFFRMLGEDVHIDQSQGEWLGFDFDHESLNFTAEFVGPVTAEQVGAFHSAFDGTTGLRRATIAQFAHIADAIEEDEVIGFGLYLNEGDDPAEWRCLSRRDALRITEEIRMLLGAGEGGQESHLPAVADVNTGARYLFGRRDRGVEAAKLAGAVREVEANLSKRISRLEGEVADHSGHIQDLRSKSVEAEQSMGRLLSAVEGFCEQAANRLETVTAAPALSAAAARVPIEAPIEAPAENSSSVEAPPSQSAAAEAPQGSEAAALPLWGTSSVTTAAPFSERRSAWWRSPTVISVGVGAAVILLGMLLWPSSPSPDGSGQVTSASDHSAPPPVSKPAVSVPEAPGPAPTAVPAKVATANPESVAVNEKPAPDVANPAPRAAAPDIVGATRVELEASEPTWISIRGGDGTTLSRLIEPGDTQTVDIREPAILRSGNAGGLTIHSNGKSLGPLGPHGAIREVEFKDGAFKLVPIK